MRRAPIIHRVLLSAACLGASMTPGLRVHAEEPTLPDQVVVLRSPPSTTARVIHRPGDRVALLELDNPPDDATEVISAQVGPFVGKVEHVLRERSQLTLLLRLTTDMVDISVRRLRSPPGWTFGFAPRAEPPFPSPAQLIGHLPGLIPPPPRPVLLPVEPRDTPCTGSADARALEAADIPRSELDLERQLDVIDDPICRTWAASRLAARALEKGVSVEPFERWAFRAYMNDLRWPLQDEARAQASLVLAEILARREYFPEARALLADASRYRRRHAPFRAMALANLFATRKEHDEAETLYRQMIVEGFEPLGIERASLARSLNALEGGDTLGALKYAERARVTLEDAQELPGDLWLVGGEAALALGELALARKHYGRAARSPEDPVRGIGLLRLADLEIRAGRTKSALAGWALAGRREFPCATDHVHLRRVITLEKDRAEVMRFLQSTARFSRCEPVRMEAKFALSRIQLERGDDGAALSRAVQVVEDGISRWGPARAHRAMVTEVAAAAVARRVRHRDPAELVEFFEDRLEPIRHLLPPRSRLEVGRAYHAIGASARGAEELVDLVTEKPKLAIREELLLTLGEAFLGAGDTYRADLVLRHLEARHVPGRQPGRRKGLVARYEIAVGRYADGLRSLASARADLPPGDRRDALGLSAAKAHLASASPAAAGNAFLEAIRSEILSDAKLIPVAIEVLSECARSCSRAQLRAFARPTIARLGTDFLSPRLVRRLAREGALDATSGSPSDEPSTLWTRLEALGVNR